MNLKDQARKERVQSPSDSKTMSQEEIEKEKKLKLAKKKADKRKKRKEKIKLKEQLGIKSDEYQKDAAESFVDDVTFNSNLDSPEFKRLL
jgi:hypothetical protein